MARLKANGGVGKSSPAGRRGPTSVQPSRHQIRLEKAFSEMRGQILPEFSMPRPQAITGQPRYRDPPTSFPSRIPQDVPRQGLVSERRSEFARARLRDTNGRFLITATKECAVCSESKSLSFFPGVPVSRTCLHSPNTCLACVRTSIRVDFETRQWNHIHCPECREVLDYHDVQKYADQKTFYRFGSFSLALYVRY